MVTRDILNATWTNSGKMCMKMSHIGTHVARWPARICHRYKMIHLVVCTRYRDICVGLLQRNNHLLGSDDVCYSVG